MKRLKIPVDEYFYTDVINVGLFVMLEIQIYFIWPRIGICEHGEESSGSV
jgi:hypothetical protein